MSASTAPGFSVRVDTANPGQFFACCGLLELACRLNPDARGFFGPATFSVSDSPSIQSLVQTVCGAELIRLDPEDLTASPILLSAPFTLRLDWWKSAERADTDLKVWAGRMDSFRIARAMQNAMRASDFNAEDLLDDCRVSYDPDDPSKKTEPFYFDSRRGPNAHSRDIGFAPNDLDYTTLASPAVELLCLIGLQRTRPARTDTPRVFEYSIWHRPLPSSLSPAAASGMLPDYSGGRFRFESWFRTSQRKHKAFLPAKSINPTNP
jgi:CRISPR-associated protein Csb3